jgi:dTMP kinase
LQTLHVAAHLDAIERKILPALEAGTWVILDRYWWSTWVYGIEQGISSTYLEPVIKAEQARWER